MTDLCTDMGAGRYQTRPSSFHPRSVLETGIDAAQRFVSLMIQRVTDHSRLKTLLSLSEGRLDDMGLSRADLLEASGRPTSQSLSDFLATARYRNLAKPLVLMRRGETLKPIRQPSSMSGYQGWR